MKLVIFSWKLSISANLLHLNFYMKFTTINVNNWKIMYSNKEFEFVIISVLFRKGNFLFNFALDPKNYYN